MHEDLRGAFKAIREDPSVRCLLITGAGRAFSSGADLAARREQGAGSKLDLGDVLEKNFNPLIRNIRSLAFPVVAAVNGPAAGAGMSLALAADLVVAARSAYFLQAFCNIGLVPDAGSTYFLPRVAGAQRAAGLMLLGEKLPAEKAEEWGIIWKCVDDDALMAEATTIARRLASGPKGLSLIKQAILASAGNDLDGQLDTEKSLQSQAGGTQDFVEGVSAFLEKREAKFQGR
jgi:2-(1,2-epoxy-1,2-dihydrophenyl)acetyl-CoA isomerase